MYRTSLDQGGHDWGEANLDALGVFYITFAILYTLLIVYGLLKLWRIRHTTAVRLRSLWSIFSAVIAIHIYLLFVLLVYPLNGLFRCGLEFWLMSVLLPLGMALFQLSNVRLLSHYDEQQKLIRGYNLYRIGSQSDRIPWRQKWCQLSELKKTRIGVITGMAIQLILTTILFFGSRQFHSSYGAFSQGLGPGQCRTGYEWIPSVFWQFIWSAVFGPLLILRTRHIHDTHFWSLQMRLTVIASLPGTPLWLAGIYSNDPGFAVLNRWFVPAGWFIPGIMTMQLVSIYVPIHDAAAMHKLSERLCTGHSNDEAPAPAQPTWIARRSLVAHVQRRDYSLHSLDYQLEHNIEPLLQWAAQKEFTAENVLFLRAVLEWKKKWQPVDLVDKASLHEQRQAYTEAGQIYSSLVDPQTASLYINIDHHTFRELRAAFKPFTVGRSNSNASADSESTSSDDSSLGRSAVAPWEDVEATIAALPALPSPIVDLHESPLGSGTAGSITSSSAKKSVPIVTLTELRRDSVTSEVELPVSVPSFFGIEVFDRAYGIVRNDVYVNTWSRYEAMFSRPPGTVEGSRTSGMVADPTVLSGWPLSGVFRRCKA